MNDVNKLLSDLDGFSLLDGPVSEVAKDAADRIRYLSAQLNNSIAVVDRLQRDKIILREALLKIVGVSVPAELEVMKKQVEAILTLSGPNKDVESALSGINALLDTV